MHNSIFLEFSLPNSTTWFYFSVILATALFFKFRRFFSLRNWDLLALFAMVPGLLLVQEGKEWKAEPPAKSQLELLRLLPDPGGIAMVFPGASTAIAVRNRDIAATNRVWWGYATLLGAKRVLAVAVHR